MCELFKHNGFETLLIVAVELLLLFKSELIDVALVDSSKPTRTENIWSLSFVKKLSNVLLFVPYYDFFLLLIIK